MAKGMGHDEARKASAAPTAPADVKMANARAKKHADAMGKGKSHDEARKAAGEM